MDKSRPLAVTMGCPVGIGPEIILKFFSSVQGSSTLQLPVVIGSKEVLEWCSRSLNIPAKIASWRPGDVVKDGIIQVFEPESCPALDCSLFRYGFPNKVTGLAMARYIETAVELVLNKELGGIVTCPIAKSTLNRAGYGYPGHTEMLAELCFKSLLRILGEDIVAGCQEPLDLRVTLRHIFDDKPVAEPAKKLGDPTEWEIVGDGQMMN